ncbi:hypothetical protein [Pseudomonas sp. MWU13-3659]|uniref:hypothetical protein n=1 Tax=Pseudomonas sp. MWU13-3659 TaxID=2986964 RepID=UPI002075854C|nr:hypothetical protein [Pseudomonas sp. MWU13-3659]
MERFSNSLRSSVNHQDWYVALSTALTLPDVCGRLIDPAQGSSKRYAAWFDQWAAPSYSIRLPAVGLHCFLNGSDCYALRCSYLHEGGADITQQRARKALDDFHFIVPPVNGNSIHCNKINNTLQLQVDLFCLDIADAVDRWAVSVKDNQEIQNRMRSLLTVHNRVTGVGY